jgi:transcription antitermination factor NusB
MNQSPRPRALARELAFQYAFACEASDDWRSEMFAEFLEARNAYTRSQTPKYTPPPAESISFAKELIEDLLARREEIDVQIATALKNWDFSRLTATTRNILRVGAAELTMLPQKLDAPVIIVEALKLAEKFDGADTAKFVNGVLDAIAADLAIKK